MAITVTVPDELKVRVDVRKIVRRAGNKGASWKRMMLKAGMGARGATTTADRFARTGHTAMNDTGRLINSIKFQPRGDKTWGIIGPTGTRPDGKRNATLFYILFHGWKQGRKQIPGIKVSDPLGVDASTLNVIEQEIAREVSRQSNTGEIKLIARGRKKR